MATGTEAIAELKSCRARQNERRLSLGEGWQPRHASAGFTLTTYGHLLPGMADEAVARLATARAEARQKLAESAAASA
ncbi:MAG: hypothetical protein CVT59_04465 [Actinobacteria bacterium HGW-Actinobacteria-1]|nr:MAG: hypothetical protein CVT59_04465 [Actinobacteria bacterium HGW-Actinobacteria-1]